MNIPILGLGTRRLQGSSVLDTVKMAIELGYRHFDTAWIYQNESELGKAFSESKVSREKLWITTKVWFDYVPNHKPHSFQQSDFGYTQLIPRFDQSLKDMKTDYFDLVLLHWPTNFDNDAMAFEQLLKLKKAGHIRNIGVANFPLEHIKNLYNRFGNEIFTNQIEWHPLLSNTQLELFAKEKNLKLTAYSPLGQGHLLKNPDLLNIANREHISVAQLCISYLLSKGAIVIPKASSYERLEENLQAREIKLSQEAITLIDELPKTYRYCNPPFAPQWQ